jgi:hypothetical protein
VTGTDIPARRDRWLRAVGYGLLAEIATIVTIIAFVKAYRYMFVRGQSDAFYAAFDAHAGATIGVVGGTLYTFLFARLLMRRLTSRFVAHGLVVALTAVAFSIAGSIAGHHGVPGAYMLASVLKLAAGALAGFLAAKRFVPPVGA